MREEKESQQREKLRKLIGFGKSDDDDDDDESIDD